MTFVSSQFCSPSCASSKNKNRTRNASTRSPLNQTKRGRHPVMSARPPTVATRWTTKKLGDISNLFKEQIELPLLVSYSIPFQTILLSTHFFYLKKEVRDYHKNSQTSHTHCVFGTAGNAATYKCRTQIKSRYRFVL